MAFFDSTLGKIILGLWELGNVPQTGTIISDTDTCNIQITDVSTLTIKYLIEDTDSCQIQESENSGVFYGDTRYVHSVDTCAIEITDISEFFINTENAIVTQLYDETLVSETSNARVTELFDETLVSQVSNARVTQLYNEALVSETSNARVTEIYNETLVAVHRFHLYENCQIEVTETSKVTIKVATSDICQIQISRDEHKPVLFAVYPGVLPEFQPNVTLTCIGWGFLPTSIIVWNGINLVTTYISPEELTGILPPQDINIIGEMPVHILDP